MASQPLWPGGPLPGQRIPGGWQARKLRDFDSRCAYCFVALDGRGSYHWEHMLAASRGGRATSANLVPACVDCDFSKADRLLCEWLFPEGWPL